MPKGVEHMHGILAHEAAHGVRPSLMPKGVEHTIVGRRWLPMGVRPSLMPKGVEHSIAPSRRLRAAFGATLFDAERR